MSASQSPSDAESALWIDLWKRPVAHLWRGLYIAPMVIARYVRVLSSNPASGSLAQMESALGLTPASLGRLRVQFEAPIATAGDDDVQALLDAALDRWEARK